MNDYQLSESEIAGLKLLHRTLKKKREADKVKAVYSLGSGIDIHTVAFMLDITVETIKTYFAQYKQLGKDNFYQMSYAGKEPYLTPAQQDELAQYVESNFHLRSVDFAVYIQKEFKVNYKPTAIKELLHKLGFTYHKPKHVPGKCDIAAQEKFVEEYRLQRQMAGKNEVFLFGDACHPTHNSIPAYGWIRKGAEKELKSNSGRQRVNINGFLDIDTKETIVDFTDSVNAQSVIRLLSKLLLKYPLKLIHLYVDNAVYYRARLVSDWLRLHCRVRLHFLPKYSPNLNLIERLWKFFKKTILYNRYYEKFSDFMGACKSFFRCRRRYISALDSLVTENFQLAKTREIQNG